MPDRYASLKQGLVGCWIPSVSGSGFLLPDLSQRGNHGSLVGMAADDWVSSQYGRALDFDGTDDYVAIGSNVFSGLSVVTVSLWGKPRTTSSRIEISQGADSLNRTTYGFSEDGNAYVVPNFAGSLTGFVYCNWSSFGVSSFLHGVFIYNSQGSSNAERAKIYINGLPQTVAESGTVPTVAISQGGTPFIGARPGPASYSNGEFGGVAVWNRELTLSEIRLLASRPGIGLRQESHRQTFYQFPSGVRRRLLLTGQT